MKKKNLIFIAIGIAIALLLLVLPRIRDHNNRSSKVVADAKYWGSFGEGGFSWYEWVSKDRILRLGLGTNSTYSLVYQQLQDKNIENYFADAVILTVPECKIALSPDRKNIIILTDAAAGSDNKSNNKTVRVHSLSNTKKHDYLFNVHFGYCFWIDNKHWALLQPNHQSLLLSMYTLGNSAPSCITLHSKRDWDIEYPLLIDSENHDKIIAVYSNRDTTVSVEEFNIRTKLLISAYSMQMPLESNVTSVTQSREAKYLAFEIDYPQKTRDIWVSKIGDHSIHKIFSDNEESNSSNYFGSWIETKPLNIQWLPSGDELSYINLNGELCVIHVNNT